MADRPDVEFVADDGEPDTGNEVLVLRRGGPSRWVWLALVAVAAVVLGLLLADHGGAHHAATPSASLPVTQTVTSAPPVPDRTPPGLPPGLGPRLPLPGTGPALDLVTTLSSTWVLQPRRITLVDSLRTVVATASWPGAPAGATARLQVDAITGSLWVIVEGGRTGRVFQYNAFTLTPERRITLGPIGGASALYDHLYVTSGGRLIDIPSEAAPHVVALTRAHLGPVATDLARSLIVVLDLSEPTHVWRFRPGHGLTPTALILPVTKASVGVTSHGDWAAGFATTGPLLWHVTGPVEQATGVRTLAHRLSPGAVISAAGRDVIWIRAGAATDDLWCVNAATGRVEQHWVAPGPVASTSGMAVIGTSTGAARLDLSGCPG